MSCDYHRLPHPGIQALSPYIPGKSIEELAREQGLTDIIKLASNENPLGCSPLVREALARMTGTQLATYPSPANHPLTHKLSAHLGISPSMLTLGNGSDLLFSLIMTTFALHQGKHLLTHELAFITYQIQAQTLGIPVHKTPLKPNWEVDIDAIIQASNENTGVICLANPNNPTGLFISPDEIKRLLDGIPASTIVILDEAYYEYTYPLGDKTSIHLLSDYPNLILTRSFSKIYGLAGLRLGYAIANPVITELLQRVQLPFVVNQAALEAAYAALDDSDFITQSLKMNAQGKQQLLEGLDRLGLNYLPTHCNFVTIDCQTKALELYQKLLTQAVIVRPLIPYGLDRHLRISIGTPLQNTRFLDKLELCLSDRSCK